MAYPIFFQAHGTIETCFQPMGWFWCDPDLSPVDVGPFENRLQAIVDYSFELLKAEIQATQQDLDQLLAMPLLQAPISCAPIANSISDFDDQINRAYGQVLDLAIWNAQNQAINQALQAA